MVAWSPLATNRSTRVTNFDILNGFLRLGSLGMRLCIAIHVTGVVSGIWSVLFTQCQTNYKPLGADSACMQACCRENF